MKEASDGRSRVSPPGPLFAVGHDLVFARRTPSAPLAAPVARRGAISEALAMIERRGGADVAAKGVTPDRRGALRDIRGAYRRRRRTLWSGARRPTLDKARAAP